MKLKITIIVLLWVGVLLLIESGPAQIITGATITGNVKMGAVIPPPVSGADDNTYCGVGNIPAFGTTDDVAILPRSCLFTALSATPANSGTTWVVNTLADLNAAITASACGDIIQLTKGITINTANAITFPAKACNSTHWIWVMSSGVSDLAFPTEGTRTSPCFSGIASMTGRPVYSCLAPTLLTAKIVNTGTTAGPIKFAAGASFYRFMGLEVTRGSTGGITGSLIGLGTAHHLIFDRVWVHGTPAEGTLPQLGATTDTSHLINLAQSNSIATINSYLNDAYCISGPGACTEGHAIVGGIGTTANSGWGIYKIVNNFLEASGQSIILGGGDGPCLPPTLSASCPIDSPSDIEIRRNSFFKPLQWMPPDGLSATFRGWPVVKNSFEIKNAVRVLLEGNVATNVWGGFSQAGFTFLFTPKNQSGLCPGCILTDVTARYNLAIHVGGAIQFLSASSDAGENAKGAFRESIHDNSFDGVYFDSGGGQGPLDQTFGISSDVSGSSGMVQDSLHVIHNTFNAASNSQLAIEIRGKATESNHVFRDNIYIKGAAETVGNAGSCADAIFTILGQLNACWTSYSFLNNIVVGGSQTGGFYPATTILSARIISDVGFANYKAEGGDLRLCTGVGTPISACLGASAYIAASSDGLPEGANITLLNTKIAGVQ